MKYTKGDWVTCLPNRNIDGGAGYAPGLTFQLSKDPTNLLTGNEDNFVAWGAKHGCGVYFKALRAALPHEISQKLYLYEQY